MNESVILKVLSVTPTDVEVELGGRVGRITRIRLQDIPTWFGVDENGYSVSYTVKAGQKIAYDRLGVFDTLINPKFL